MELSAGRHKHMQLPGCKPKLPLQAIGCQTACKTSVFAGASEPGGPKGLVIRPWTREGGKIIIIKKHTHTHTHTTQHNT